MFYVIPVIVDQLLVVLMSEKTKCKNENQSKTLIVLVFLDEMVRIFSCRCLNTNEMSCCKEFLEAQMNKVVLFFGQCSLIVPCIPVGFENSDI